MSETCLWCEATRVAGPVCPRCGANYAKAEAIKLHGRAGDAALPPVAATAPLAGELAALDEDEAKEFAQVDDLDLEWKLCAAGIPAMLGIALAFKAIGLGPMLQRIFFGMPVHELGHAVTAWLCGFWAIPTFWVTFSPDERGMVAPLLLLGGIGYTIHRAWVAQVRSLLVAGGTVLLLQAVGTLFIREQTAQSLIVFGGDGMGMIIATLLMASFFFGKTTQLYKGALRWGFVAIGAAAFVDLYSTWWAVKRHDGEIPYGVFESGMRSDALRLVEDYGWKEAALVNRYYFLGLLCLAALTLMYAWGVRHALRQARAGKSRAARFSATQNG